MKAQPNFIKGVPLILKADLHIHSICRKRLSYCPFLYDSVQTVNAIIQRALDSEIRILAITDHDTLAGYRKAKRIIESCGLDLLLIPGCEISSAEGHILAYQIETEIPKGLSANETVARIHDQGGYAVAAHPYFVGSLKDRVFDLDLDAFEGFNSTVCIVSNIKSIDAARRMGLPYLANSDAHQVEEIGRSYTLFPDQTHNAADLFRHLRAGEYVTYFTRSDSLQMIKRHLYRNLQIQFQPNLRPSRSEVESFATLS